MLYIPGEMSVRYLGAEACEAWGEVAPTVRSEHLEECRGYAFLRAGKDLFLLSDRIR